MKAVLLAAGEGTRLRSRPGDPPKVLLEVAGEPLLTHGLCALAALEVEEIVLVVGQGAKAIRSRYGDAFEGCPLAYVHQSERKGLAHALLSAEARVAGPFVAMHGDNFFAKGVTALRPVLDRFREEGLAVSLLIERVPPDCASRGVCLTGPDGQVREVVEHPTPAEQEAGLVVAGFYAFAPAIFQACRAIHPSQRGEYELPDAITWLVRAAHPAAATELRGARVNVNTPEDLDRARRLASS